MADELFRKPNLSEARIRLERTRAGWRYALAVVDQADELQKSLPPGNPDGSRALHEANRLLREAGDEYRAALRAFILAGGDRRQA